MNRIVINKKVLDMFSIGYSKDKTVYVLVGYAIGQEESESRILQISEALDSVRFVITSTNEVTKEAKSCIAPVDKSQMPFLIFEICTVQLKENEDTKAETVEFYIFDGSINEYVSLGNISRQAVLEEYKSRSASFIESEPNDKKEN